MKKYMLTGFALYIFKWCLKNCPNICTTNELLYEVDAKVVVSLVVNLRPLEDKYWNAHSGRNVVWKLEISITAHVYCTVL